MQFKWQFIANVLQYLFDYGTRLNTAGTYLLAGTYLIASMILALLVISLVLVNPGNGRTFQVQGNVGQVYALIKLK